MLFDLPEEALDSIPSELSFIVSGMSELEIKFTSSSSAFSVEANLLLKNEVFVGLCVAIEDSSAQSISTPTNTISADSRNAMLEWASTADWDKFIKNLKDSPLGDIVPEETWEQLEQNLPAA